MSRLLALVVLLAIRCMAHAESIAVPVEGENWAVSFDAPALKPVPLPFRPKGFAYYGNADRLNLSFFVETPACAGGDEPSVRFTCFTSNLAKNPFLVRESVRSMSATNGLFVVYGLRVPFKGALLKHLHMHLLFYEGGKEVDFHVSYVEPNETDAAALGAIIQSVRVMPK